MTAPQRAGDLLFQDDVREMVRRAYQDIAAGAGRAVAERFYSDAELATVPDRAIAWALGVGNPTRHAELAEGETVLDIGCGGGMDTILAAHRVGTTGRIIGLDTLPEMCDRAAAAAEAAGVGDRCELVPGEMEDIPLPDESVDVVISNGVLNLSPRKSRALAEVARVLRPGGRLCVADLTVEDELPPAVLASGAAWAGCIAGAVSERVLVNKLHRVGFEDVELSERTPFDIDAVAAYPLFTPEVLELMRQLIPPQQQGEIAAAMIVRATKPQAAPEAAVRQALSAQWIAGARSLEDIPPDAVEAPGVTIRHLKTVEDIQLKVLDVEVGGSTPFHTHAHAHEGVVVTGTGALRLEDRRERLQPGDVFSVNPTQRHAIESEGPEPLRFVCLDCFVE